MTSADLLHVLKILYDAGGSRVPSEELGWTSEMTPAILRALNMQYMISRDTRRGRCFSLTRAGYDVLGADPPAALSLSRTLRLLFGINSAKG